MTQTETTQQEFLAQAKAELGLQWDDFALMVGVHPRTLKAYRLPETSSGFRSMPYLVRQEIERRVEHLRQQGA
ncbi:hypothetical protein AACH06_25590 [Ideonella sp. DXS29W]|uniref:Transcriptional regulator n=1 Tax=Ideonella lacteola TaxID=2984193 RepID=A0ABU9BYM5_9BURK